MSDLDFASVVRVGSHLPNWSQVRENNNPFLKLHSKFWGKILTCEDPQPSVQNELTDKAQYMEVDSVDDDFIPGCAILNIGIDGLPFQKIWIRADYIRVYNYLEKHEIPPRSINILASAAVVTGQPGIGKTVWVYYALCRRLVERKPVIWYRGHSCYLFSKEGVFRAPPDFPSDSFRIFVWTLVDSDESKEGAPSHLLTPGTRLYVIYVTSPDKERWSRIHKTARNVRVIMNPWRRKEINNAASIYSFSDSDRELINLLYERLGPTPRLCIDFLRQSDSFTQYENEVEKEVKALTSQTLQKIFDNACSLKTDKVSHKISLLSRQIPDHVASLAVIEPITLYIRWRLVCQVRAFERLEQVRLYKRSAKTPGSRALADITFEAAGQAILRDGAVLELFPMVHQAPKQDTPRPLCYSSHVLQGDAELEQLRQLVLGKTLTLEVRPFRVCEYTDSEPLAIEPNVFYLPQTSIQVTLGAFILLNGFLYLFQFAIGEHLDVKLGLKDFFKQCDGIPAIEDWRLVFIIPPNHTLVVPQPWSLDIRAIPFYSAVIAL